MSSRGGSVQPPSGKKPTAAERAKALTDDGRALLQLLVAAGIEQKAKHAQIDIAAELADKDWTPDMLRSVLEQIKERVGIYWKESAASQLRNEGTRKSLLDAHYATKRERIGLDHHFEIDADKRAHEWASWTAELSDIAHCDAYETRIAQRYDELIEFSGWDLSHVPERYQPWLAKPRELESRRKFG